MDINSDPQKLAILCVDDEPSILDTLEIEISKVLEDEYLIEVAESGEEALELIDELTAQEYEIAVIISDHIMPNLKGDELLQQVHLKLPNTLKIMLTGQADVQAIGNVINNAKLYRYIPKPWNSEELRLIVKDAVRTYLHDKMMAEQHAKLKQLDALKDQFLANTSHELRTPLNGIIGASEFLHSELGDQLTDIQEEMLSVITQSSNRLLHLVSDILDFSYLKRNAIVPKLQPLNIDLVIRKVLTVYQPIVKHRSTLSFVNNTQADLPLVMADEERVQQVLHNFIDNALKFTNEGEVEIAAKIVWRDPDLYLSDYSSDVLVTAEQYDIGVESSHYVAIHVKDTGIGIPKHKISRIFESFEQVDGSSARSYEGSGLGLSIAQQLVTLQNGEIFVESAENQGSCFTFTLPLASEQQIAEAKNAPPPLFKEHSNLVLSPLADVLSTQHIDSISSVQEDVEHDAIKVLLVDDDFVNLRLLSIYLSTQPYEIITANSGEKALALIKEGLQPDLIATDVMMPQIDGYTLTAEVRKRWHEGELPILLLSAKNQPEDIIQGLTVGANDYLTKPIAREELVARIESHLKLKRLHNKNTLKEAELNIARRIQQWVLPRQHELDKLDDLDIAGFMQPAENIGGDYCDVLKYNGHIVCGIGDVIGHGLESSVLMLMVQTAMRTLLAHHVTSPELCLKVLNRALYDNIQRMKLDKALTLALFSYHNGRLRFSGQHEIILLITKDAKIRQIDTTDLGFIVGLEPSIEQFVSAMEVELREGDGVVLYSDGVIEARNTEHETYSLERLCEVVKQNWDEDATQVQQAVINDLRQHINDSAIHDDITLLVIKKK
ncbi:response regulator [Candidatus Albibeggiatoa sp. nov. NOAA]|uniref:response regulator n=1 Tax=Candidatus Albibeggiatoa sp. nov. NOAA TaxID=3162724 RepID=UPI0032F6A6D9|nr:response regulator [Thiotrichaceae bacterium]